MRTLSLLQPWATLVAIALSGFRDISAREHAFGDYSDGRFAWLLADAHKLARPVICRGALGIWRAPADVERAVREQLVA